MKLLFLLLSTLLVSCTGVEEEKKNKLQEYGNVFKSINEKDLVIGFELNITLKSITGLHSSLSDKMNKIEALSLNGKSVDNKTILNIGPSKSLKYIDLTNSCISDFGVQQLVKFPNLEMINLTGCDLSAKSLKTLNSFDKLRCVSISYKNDITDSIIKKNMRANINVNDENKLWPSIFKYTNKHLYDQEN